MPMAHKPTADLVFTWKDASGSVGSTHFHVPYDTTAAAVIAAADVLRPLLRALSNAEIIGQSLTYSYGETNPFNPDAGSRVEEKGFFSYRTDNARSTNFTIPAFWDAALNVDGTINRSHPAVVALDAAIVAVDAIFCGPDGSDINGLLQAYQRFNRSTKGQLPKGR